MKFSNGRVLIFLGGMHALFAVGPAAFGEQFAGVAGRFFFQVSEGLLEFPLVGGRMEYANFAAFWFFYFGLLLIPAGLLLDAFERAAGNPPASFVWSYLIVVLVGVYMIPFSGMTFLMLPHALYMLTRARYSVV